MSKNPQNHANRPKTDIYQNEDERESHRKALKKKGEEQSLRKRLRPIMIFIRGNVLDGVDTKAVEVAVQKACSTDTVDIAEMKVRITVGGLS